MKLCKRLDQFQLRIAQGGGVGPVCQGPDLRVGPGQAGPAFEGCDLGGGLEHAEEQHQGLSCHP